MTELFDKLSRQFEALLTFPSLLQLAGLATAGADVPRLAEAGGRLEFARGGTQLRLTTGMLEELRITDARVDWPRRGEPRLRATAQGELGSPLLRRALEEQGLGRLAGAPGATGGIERLNAFFLLIDEPEVYNLPRAPIRPANRVVAAVVAGIVTVGGLALAALALFASRDRT